MSLKEKINFLKNILSKKWEILVAIWITIITIVILYSYFLSWNENSRDAIRYANILKINDELKIYYSKNNIYPLPDESVNISANSEILNYQWFVWENVFKNLWLQELKDPSSNDLFKYLNYYTYAITEDKQKFQLMAFYESNEQDKYMPTTSRIPFNYWEKVWIAIENKTLRPIQETKLWLDILNTDEDYSIYLDNENIISWNKDILKAYYAKSPKSESVSCLEIRNSWINESWFYYIVPVKWAKTIKVYCDMETDWWWWTRLYYKKWKETCFNDENYFTRFMIDNLLTKDFAVSDKTSSLQSEWSWILKNVELKDELYNSQQMANLANCKTPTWTNWSSDFSEWYMSIKWTLNTMWTWQEMFFWCDYTRKIGEEHVIFNMWWINQYWMTWDFIHSLCSNYSTKNNSITSRWNWDNTRTIWVR